MYIFGHKNPDSDSVCSAIALSYLKKHLGTEWEPRILGKLNKESGYILDYFNIDIPKILDNVKTQVKDLKYDKTLSMSPNDSILSCYRYMEGEKLRTLPITDENNKLLGIVTMKDIAMSLIQGDFYKLKTNTKNIRSDLNGKLLAGEDKEIDGSIKVISIYHKTLRAENTLSSKSVVILGDVYESINQAIESNVQLILISSDKTIPERLKRLADSKGVTIISVPEDTYTISKLLNQCNYISTICREDSINMFYEDEFLDDVREELSTNRHSYYPIVTRKKEYLGILNRLHILKPQRKKVILVDHNEFSQSVDGVNEAKIVEIVDHHKIGGVRTNKPISFRNIPVGSTCTIVKQMYDEAGVPIPTDIAGILMSGIVSDTLYFKSPTTTIIDKMAVEDLNSIVNIDLDNYVMDMFKIGTSLENDTIDEIFNKDFKEFYEDDFKLGVSQVFTMDIDDVFNREREFLDYLVEFKDINNHDMTILLVTDIIKNGSHLLYKTKSKGVLKRAFNIDPYQGIFLPGIVSRKKQVVPKILNALDN